MHTILRPTGTRCRGDPVVSPAGPWRAGTRDDAVPSRKIAPGRGTASPLHAPQDPPSPGAARRPLPARERRLFLVSLGRGGSVPSTHSTERTLPAGNVGATRWVARRGRGGWAPGMMPCRRARFAPGRRTASPLHAPRAAACVVPINIAARGRTRCRGGSRTAPTTFAVLRRRSWTAGVSPASAPAVWGTHRGVCLDFHAALR